MRVTSVSGEAEKAGLKARRHHHLGEPNEKGEKQDMPVRGSSSLVVWARLQDVGSKHTFRIKRGDKVFSLEITLVDYGWKGEAPEKYRRK